MRSSRTPKARSGRHSFNFRRSSILMILVGQELIKSSVVFFKNSAKRSSDRIKMSIQFSILRFSARNSSHRDWSKRSKYLLAAVKSSLSSRFNLGKVDLTLPTLVIKSTSLTSLKVDRFFITSKFFMYEKGFTFLMMDAVVVSEDSYSTGKVIEKRCTGEFLLNI